MVQFKINHLLEQSQMVSSIENDKIFLFDSKTGSLQVLPLRVSADQKM